MDLGKRAILLAFVAGTLAGNKAAEAQVNAGLDSVLTFGQTWVECNYLFFSHVIPPEGIGNARVFGVVDGAQAPFQDILTGVPGTEITYVVSGLTVYSYDAWDGYDAAGEDLAFKNGTFRLYSDTTPDADVSNSTTYEDGDLLLEGTIDRYGFRSCFGNCEARASHGGWVTFTGGALVTRVDPRDAWFIHEIWDEHQPFVSADSTLQFPSSGTLRQIPPVHAKPVSWGRIKSLFKSG